ncbi:hypothetical protein L210DRAFT_956763 [Boletus edulis BED1]|uniref:Uncharacterized protein n=1 Tax=Boletus edulis BED1 TaxID=1328754 RepID=A0AAD4C7F4_BOLED|nr:hypothetical protein L210DRAFT_956763 [Boletus edulis BED1]
MDTDTATIQYRLSLPHALYSVSPALSALHTSRATALHPEISAVLHPTHCPKCGTYHFSGDHSSYLVGLSAKKKRKRAISPHAKVLRRRCHFCGFLIDILDHSPAQLSGDSSRIGTVPSTPKTGQGPPSSDIHRPTAGTVQTPTPSLPRQPHPKPSHSSLRDMLSRDRHREDVAKSHKKRKEGQEGLAAFLKEL